MKVESNGVAGVVWSGSGLLGLKWAGGRQPFCPFRRDFTVWRWESQVAHAFHAAGGNCLDTAHLYGDAYGGSNWSAERLQEANEYAAANGLTPFIANSPRFRLAVQKEPPWPDCVSVCGPAGEGAHAWCHKNGVTLFVWSSLAGGFFSGRFRRDNLDTLTESYDQLAVKVYCEEGNFKRLDRVQELAADKGVSLFVPPRGGRRL